MSNPGFRRRPRPRTVFCALLALAVSGAAGAAGREHRLLGRRDPGRFPQGRHRRRLDRHRRTGDDRAGAAGARRRRHAGRVADRRRARPGLGRHRPRRQAVELPGAGPPKVVFDAAELDLQAIAAGPQGSVLVGSSPDGKVYRVAADGTSTTFFDPEDKYIWAIAVAPDGTTYVGTGAKGKVYKVPAAGGAGTLFYDTGTEHVSALAFDGDGQAARRHVDAGPRRPARRRWQAVRDPRSRLPGGAQPPRRRRRHLRHGRRPRDRRAGDRRRPAPPPTPRAAVTMSTEVTVIAGGDSSVVTAGTGDQRRRVARQRPAEGRHLPHRRRRRLDDGVGIARRRALRRARRAGRQPARRHRRQGQAVSAVRRSDARHARDARRRRSRSPRSPTTAPAASSSRRPIPAGCCACRRSRRRPAPTCRTSATRRRWRPGARSAGRRRCPSGTAIELHTRTGNTRTPDATWSAWSGPYTDGAGLAHRQPEGALPAVEGRADRRQRRQPGAHLGVRRLPAAQHAPDRRQRHGAPARRRVPAALPDRRSRAGRLRRHGRIRAPPVPGTPSVGQTLGRRTFQKSLQTFVWSARDTDGDRLQYDAGLPARRRPDVDRAQGRPRRRRLHLGHDDGAGRHLRDQGDGVRRRRQRPDAGAAGRAREPELRDRQHAADRDRGPGRHGRRGRHRPLHGAGHARRPSSGWSTRAPAIAGARRIRSTACSIRARNASS